MSGNGFGATGFLEFGAGSPPVGSGKFALCFAAGQDWGLSPSLEHRLSAIESEQNWQDMRKPVLSMSPQDPAPTPTQTCPSALAALESWYVHIKSIVADLKLCDTTLV